MRFPQEEGPSYRQYVLVTAVSAAASVALWIYAWVAIVSFFWGRFVPTIDELHAVATHWLAGLGGGITWFAILINQNDRWVELRRPAPKPERTPRPLAPRSQQEMKRMNSQMGLGRRGLFPNFNTHYTAVYRSLEHNDWKITKAALKIKVAGDYVFMNIDSKYMDIVREWNRLGYIDGFVTGERQETWTLNEAGRVWFETHAHA